MNAALHCELQIHMDEVLSNNQSRHANTLYIVNNMPLGTSVTRLMTAVGIFPLDGKVSHL
jgi:hypothetical protein